ncbi:hypothetical protein M5K25_004239 [Dendrobium thyrsiflorum]|uniref:Terpene synthase metal-binding domain-containing protein n=1 Tax=Dendrobium thyrsiflorum TaxID=117978 RepID=A0ABD0VMA3_DENTH
MKWKCHKRSNTISEYYLLKEDVKRLVKEKSFADQLELFDSLQKLGVAYHFEEEIKYLLNLMKYSEEKLRMEFNEDIHVMALYFRLLREHGFEVSKEVSNVFNSKLNFARDWPVESYFLAVGMTVEPQFSTCRKELAKALCFINVIDDFYDIYDLLDELQLFTEVVDRWEFASIISLPEYMKICLEGLFNMVNLLATKIKEEKGLDVLPNLKRAWLDLCKAYKVEARWYHSGYCPTFEDYLNNAWILVSTPLLSVIAHCLSENLTNLSLESFDFYPAIVRQSSIIFRFYNDLGTLKGELQRGDVSKSIQCYMKENHVSELVAQECIRNIIKKYWKELYREWIKGSRYEQTFKTVAINIPRTGHLFYLQSNDGNIGELNVEETKDNTISLLLEPITFKQVCLKDHGFHNSNTNSISFVDALSDSSLVSFLDLKYITFRGWSSLWISEDEILALVAPFKFSLACFDKTYKQHGLI